MPNKNPVAKKRLQKLLSFLREKHLSAHHDYFTNLDRLQQLQQDFYAEIRENCILLSDAQKAGYHGFLQQQLENLSIRYSPGFVEMKLRKYGQTIADFPHFTHPDLLALLHTRPCDFPEGTDERSLRDLALMEKTQAEFLRMSCEQKRVELLDKLQEIFAPPQPLEPEALPAADPEPTHRTRLTANQIVLFTHRLGLLGNMEHNQKGNSLILGYFTGYSPLHLRKKFQLMGSVTTAKMTPQYRKDLEVVEELVKTVRES